MRRGGGRGSRGRGLLGGEVRRGGVEWSGGEGREERETPRRRRREHEKAAHGTTHTVNQDTTNSSTPSQKAKGGIAERSPATAPRRTRPGAARTARTRRGSGHARSHPWRAPALPPTPTRVSRAETRTNSVGGEPQKDNRTPKAHCTQRHALALQAPRSHRRPARLLRGDGGLALAASSLRCRTKKKKVVLPSASFPCRAGGMRLLHARCRRSTIIVKVVVWCRRSASCDGRTAAALGFAPLQLMPHFMN